MEVNPAYSSVIGNFEYGDYDTPDMVAASIEIARRGYKKYCKNWFYPIFSYTNLDERWKQTLGKVKDWKELFLKIKEAKVKYRFLLTDCICNAVFSKFYCKKDIYVYTF